MNLEIWGGNKLFQIKMLKLNQELFSLTAITIRAIAGMEPDKIGFAITLYIPFVVLERLHCVLKAMRSFSAYNFCDIFVNL